jgi:hypothetical protein
VTGFGEADKIWFSKRPRSGKMVGRQLISHERPEPEPGALVDGGWWLVRRMSHHPTQVDFKSTQVPRPAWASLRWRKRPQSGEKLGPPIGQACRGRGPSSGSLKAWGWDPPSQLPWSPPHGSIFLVKEFGQQLRALDRQTSETP